MLVTSLIGYAFALDIRVQGWQVWVWAICVCVTVVMLMPTHRPALRLDTTSRWLVVLALIALLLRVTALETVPGLLHVDELGLGNFARQSVLAGPDGLTHNPFITGPASQPALYHYLIRLSLALVGDSITGLRITSALAGALAVMATYAAIAVLHNRRTALIAAVIMTTYHFHIHWSRLGLNNIWDTVWVPMVLATFVWGWRHRWSGGAVLAGLALGLSQYFYAGSKIGLILLAVIIAWRWWKDTDRGRLAIYAGKSLITAACVAAPLVMFMLRDPANYFQRAEEVFGWQSESIRQITGDPNDVGTFFWHQVTRSLGAFTTFPDTTGFYGPGVPLVIGLGSLLFVIGVLLAILQRRFIPIVWILLTALLGGFLLASVPGSSHYVVSIPAICWLIAIPLNGLAETDRQGALALVVAALLIVMLTDLYFYFGVYVPNHSSDLQYPFLLH